MVSRAAVHVTRLAGGWIFGFTAALALSSAQPAAAAIDLSRASINRLPNGLTYMVLEDRSFPVVSVQILYKSGAVDETIGKTGLAHFLEHLAFRSSKNFANAGATEAIYDAGGEWHGYTWLNQTTYFATAPKDQLELLLRIEADRMVNVTIDPAAMDAEKGAVLAEMHGYENDPQSVLFDAVAATAFQFDTQRNNTIGLEADVQGLNLADAEDFYGAHYVPANAVLAIVGDVDTDAVDRLVSQYFRAIRLRESPVRTRSPEPVQRGERRIELNGPVDRQYFTIAYPAPAASNPDVAAFLVMQQLIGAGSGFNFLQNDWGTSAEPGSLLFGLTGDVATWFAPTVSRYVFTIKGSLDRGSDRSALEQEIGRRLQSLRDRPLDADKLAAAKAAVTRQLGEDVETTEDAAHQLAYLGGYEIAARLPDRVQAVTLENIREVAAAYLNPQTRTVGWYLPGVASARAGMGEAVASTPTAQSARPATPLIAPGPQMFRLSGGLPVIFQQNPRAESATVQLLLSAPVEGEDAPADLPGLGVVTRSGKPVELASLLDDLKAAAEKPLARHSSSTSAPDSKLEEMIKSAMGLGRPTAATPILAVVSGAVDPAAVKALAEQAFGDRPASQLPVQPQVPRRAPIAERVQMDRPFAQGALGYLVAAPPPGMRDALAWRMLLYILSHDYSGRLGRSAIGEKGLAYYIASAYRTDGRRSWITLATGVDPAKADALVEEFRTQLAGLASNPPSDAEIDAARRHLLGRDISAAQSNSELARKLTREYVETGGLRTHDQLRSKLESVTRADILRAITPFASGTILRVDVAPKR